MWWRVFFVAEILCLAMVCISFYYYYARYTSFTSPITFPITIDDVGALGLNFNSIGYAILFLLAIVFAGLTWYEVDKTVELDGLGRDLVKFFSLGSLLVTFIWFSRVYIWPYLKAVRKYNLLKQEAEEVVELELPTLIPEPENASEKEKQRIRARNKVVLEQFFRGFGKYDGVDMKTFAVAEDERDSIKAAINTGDYKLANELLQNAYGTFMEQFEQDYGSTKRKKKRLPRNPLESTRKKKKPGVLQRMKNAGIAAGKAARKTAGIAARLRRRKQQNKSPDGLQLVSRQEQQGGREARMFK